MRLRRPFIEAIRVDPKCAIAWSNLGSQIRNVSGPYCYFNVTRSKSTPDESLLPPLSSSKQISIGITIPDTATEHPK